MRNPELNKLGKVLSGADAGHSSLPAEVVESRAVLARLQAATSPVPEADPASAHRALVGAMLDAAGKAKPSWPSPQPVVEATAAGEAAAAWQNAHAQAVEVAADLVVVAVLDAADMIIAEHLRPALGEVLAEAVDVADSYLPVVDLTDQQLLAAKDEHRAAALALDELAARYTSVRSAQEVLSRGRVQHDDSGLFAEFSNPRQVWGVRFAGRNQLPWRPGPSTPRSRLTWRDGPACG